MKDVVGEERDAASGDDRSSRWRSNGVKPSRRSVRVSARRSWTGVAHSRRRERLR